MVIGLLAIAAIPTVIGVGQAVSAQKKANASSKEQEKFNVVAMMPTKGDELREAGFCVLKDDQIYLDHGVQGHKFCGYYFTYPSEERHQGLVSTIADDPPMLNWIYVHAETNAVCYGARKDTIGHKIGPWSWNADERYLTLEGEEGGFVAVSGGAFTKNKVVQEPSSEAGKDEKPEMKPEEEPDDKPDDGLEEKPEVKEEKKAKEKGKGKKKMKKKADVGEDDGLWTIYWDPKGVVRKRFGKKRCKPVLLRRKLLMGMESRYVKGAKE